jgi:Bacterial aa3 type cytochrome c oxidase subunit IV
MANHDQLEYATATGNDYVAHEEMYHRFLTLTMSAIAVVAVLLIMMAIFLT